MATSVEVFRIGSMAAIEADRLIEVMGRLLTDQWHSYASVSVQTMLPVTGTLTEYIRAAMARAQYRSLDEEGIWGEIPGLQGVWANADTVDECRAELQSVLEDWILVGIARQHPIPPIDGVEIRIGQVV